jgi:uncharacterized protein YdiU (UPF0061 family)
MPLIGDEELAREALASYKTVFSTDFMARMRAKLGLAGERADDAADRPSCCCWQKTEWTTPSFGAACRTPSRKTILNWCATCLPTVRAGTSGCYHISELLALTNKALAADLMLNNNPKFVLRNHLGEQAIRAAKLGDFSEFQTLQRLLERPFDEHPGHDAWADFPPDWASSIEISCSS